MHLCIQDEQPLSTVEFRAWSALEPNRLENLFTAAMLDCGVWVLERTEPGNGYVSFLLEFACERSMDVYGALVALGIELSRHAHLSLTSLCQCARHGHCLRRLPVARIRIVIQSVSVSESRLIGTEPQGG